MEADEMDVCSLCLEAVGVVSKRPPLEGSAGSTLLNEQLRKFFITSKLLRIPEKSCLKFISCKDDSVLATCDSCEAVVSQGIRLHQEMMVIRGRIEKLAGALRHVVQNSCGRRGRGGNNDIAVKLRELLLGLDNNVDTSVVKIEVSAQELVDESQETEVYFDEDSCQNSYIAANGDGDSLLEQANYNYDDPSELTKMHKTGKRKKKRDNCSSDSDFEPESFRRQSRKSSQNIRRASRRKFVKSFVRKDGDESLGDYPCKRCKSVYTTLPGFKKHVAAHEESELLGNKYDCPNCRHPNLSEAKLRRHLTKIHGIASEPPPKVLKTVETVKGSHKCQLCKSVYSTLGGFKKHLANHEESKKLGSIFDCPKCKHPNLSEEKLRRHLVKKHETSKNTCTICGHVSQVRCVHEKHMLIQHNIKIWTPISQTEEAESRLEDVLMNEGVISPSRAINNMDQIEGKDLSVDSQVSLAITSDPFAEVSKDYFDADDKDAAPSPTSFQNKKEQDVDYNPSDDDDGGHEKLSDSGNGDAISLQDSESDSDSVWKMKIKRKSTATIRNIRSKHKGSYNCTQCESIYNTFHGFKKHKADHKESTLLGNKFDCPKCNHPNLSEEKLRRHLTKVHETLKNTCTICGHVAHRRWLHEKHMLNKHNIKVWTPISQTKNEEVSLNRKDETTKFESSNTEDKEGQEKDTAERLDLPNSQRTSMKLRDKRNRGVSDDFLDSSSNKKLKDEEWLPSDDNDLSSDAAAQESDSEPEMKISKPDEAQYFCKKCQVSYKSLRGYLVHKQEHKTSIALNHKYDCDKCGFPTSSERRLRYHKKRAHQEILMKTCTVCGYQVLRTQQLKRHMMKHNPSSHLRKVGRPRKDCEEEEGGTLRKVGRPRKDWGIEEGGKLRCSLCKVTYKARESLARHMQEHERSKLMDGKFDCDICGYPCSSENRRIRHKNVRHGKIRPTCEICNKSFLRQNQLKLHMAVHKQYNESLDPATGQFRCKFCASLFITLRGLQTHTTSVHPHPENYVDPSGSVLCPHCGQCFSSNSSLKRHVKTKHEMSFRYSCDICGKGFEEKRAFDNHLKTHDKSKVQEFVCEACGVAYKYERTLQAHMLRYHPELETNTKSPFDKTHHRKYQKEGEYKCKWCDLVFPFKYALVRHIPSHKEIYNFTCDICQKSYISASSLRLHKEITHSNGHQKFSCEHCGKQFMHKHYVICHYRFCRVKKNLEKQQKESVQATVPLTFPKSENDV